MNKNLDALDQILAAMPDEGPPKDGEFTLYEYIDRYEARHGLRLSTGAAHKRLTSETKQGIWTVRKGPVNGKQGNIYFSTQTK